MKEQVLSSHLEESSDSKPQLNSSPEARKLVDNTRTLVKGLFLATAAATIVWAGEAVFTRDISRDLKERSRLGAKIEEKHFENIDDAIRETGVRAIPNEHAVALMDLLKEQIKQGNFENANKVAEALSFQPQTQDQAYRQLAETLAAQGNTKDAKEAAQKIQDQSTREKLVGEIDAPKHEVSDEPEEGSQQETPPEAWKV